MEKLKKLFVIFIILKSLSASSQKQLSTDDFKPYTSYFKLSEDYEITGKVRKLLKRETNNAQFVGLAEIHQSQQLSYFTKGFLKLLSESCFDNFALEIGPYSANILQEISKSYKNTESNIKNLNNKYGSKNFPKVPWIFVDKKEDAHFVETASERGFKFWGLDQEFEYSFEMHFDKLYKLFDNKTTETDRLFSKVKQIWNDVKFKNTVDGINKNCWLNSNKQIDEFFNKININESISDYITSLKTSWEIYCSAASGKKDSNQQRANYMKSNFDFNYNFALKTSKQPKVFLKLGSVHLTHLLSPLGANDIGKHLNDLAKKNKTNFLSIYHLRRYKNGKDLINDEEWKDVSLVLDLGEKDRWTLIDLRPIRSLVNENKLNTSTQIKYGLNAYDFILISPDDRNGVLNY